MEEKPKTPSQATPRTCSGGYGAAGQVERVSTMALMQRPQMVVLKSPCSSFTALVV
ncbi:Uncharacterized protein DAT39_018223 [Clarias magur]|uniref:Uncharacterized protein n=1 Tax=Clarias magur TaxID=1594786 RepID=A0A8J4TK43_CLAMG|nr:Uncharacterized protein DAT39_018223 [Clarias magur]